MTHPQFEVPAQPPVAKARRWPWIAGIVVALVVGIAIGASGKQDGSQADTDGDSGPSAAAEVESPAATTTTVAPPKAVKPTPEQFTIAIKIIEKKCFGSAGCNVTYTIEPQYIGTAPLPKETITVVYEVAGGDDPQTNRFKVTGGTATMDGEETIRTPKASSVLTAKATSVL